jgi:hypothetical protein
LKEECGDLLDRSTRLSLKKCRDLLEGLQGYP